MKNTYKILVGKPVKAGDHNRGAEKMLKHVVEN
jgi:hypothetical protein